MIDLLKFLFKKKKIDEIIINNKIKLFLILFCVNILLIFLSRVIFIELEDLGLEVKCEVPIPIVYKDIVFDCNFRIDILVEDLVIIELKSVKELEDVHYKQVSTYLKLSNKKLGILVNFNTDKILNSIKRIVNKFED